LGREKGCGGEAGPGGPLPRMRAIKPVFHVRDVEPTRSALIGSPRNDLNEQDSGDCRYRASVMYSPLRLSQSLVSVQAARDDSVIKWKRSMWQPGIERNDLMNRTGPFLAGKLLLICVLSVPATSSSAAVAVPMGTISGTVVGPDGNPVAGTAVFLDDYNYDCGQYHPLVKTTTAANGSFRLGPTEAACRTDHHVRVVVDGFAPQTIAGGEFCIFPGAENKPWGDTAQCRPDSGRAGACGWKAAPGRGH